jgi:hypothetical protein
MKRLLIILILGSANYVSTAQDLRFGVTAGASFANFYSKEDGKINKERSKTGITIGVLEDIPVGKKFSLQPGFNFVQIGTQGQANSGGITQKMKFTANCLELSVSALYNLTGNSGTFFIGAGSSYKEAISGKWIIEDGNGSRTDKLKRGQINVNRISLTALTGYRFPNGLFMAAGFNAGLRNLIGGSYHDNSRDHYFSIKLGWLLKNKSYQH